MANLADGLFSKQASVSQAAPVKTAPAPEPVPAPKKRPAVHPSKTDNLSSGDDTTVRKGFYCSAALDDAIKECAYRERISESQIFREALAWRLKDYLGKA